MSGPADMEVRQGRPGVARRLSLVWLVPAAALAISLGVAWQSYTNQGTEVVISFENASGVAAEETEIRYRDVKVGQVVDVSFAEGLGEVLVTARIDKEVAPYLDQDARFWVVRPDVSVRGISGLDTVLSGVYIEGTWNEEPDVQQYEFVGLEEPPLTRASQRGTEIVLRSDDGSALSSGAPVLHKGIEVGYLETPRLSNDGESVSVSAFIEFPYDRFLTTNTRFWDTSGFEVSFGAEGLSLDVNSLASLIEGGIAFDTVVSGGAPVRDGQVFDLFDDESIARNSLFSDPDAPRLRVAVLFDESVAGLSVGSEVRFQGIRVGEVEDLGAVAIQDDGVRLVQLRAVLAIEPGRLGLGEDASPEDALDFLADFVRQGLRARLVTGNILSGSLSVQLFPVEDALADFIDLGAQPYPIVPTTASSITDVAVEAERVLARVEDLPIEGLLQSAIDLMGAIERLALSEGLVEAPDEAVALLREVRALIGSEDIQAVPAEVAAILNDISSLTEEARTAELVAGLQAVIASAGATVGDIDAATDALPELTADIQELVAKANALEVEALLTEATATLEQAQALLAGEALQGLPADLSGLVADARDIVGSDDIQALPGDLRAITADIDGLLNQISEAGSVAALNEAIASARDAAASVEDAADGLPAITAELQALAAQTRELDLPALVTAAEDTLASIDTLIGDTSEQGVPAALSGALDEMRLFLAQVNEGGAVENVNAALASANAAAQAIEDAAESLPALASRASSLVAQTETVLQSYSDRSRFNAETLQTLRDIQEAADAISALARTIQRNPSSLLTGR